VGRFSEAAGRRVRTATRKALSKIGRDIRDTIRDVISEPVTYSGGEAIRSEPGEPPYREFSDLWKSITYRVENDELLTLESLIVFTDYDVAVYLEYGTFKMEPRPFWWDTYESIRPYIRSSFEQELVRNLDPRDYGHPDVDL
jgi:hypothetical protein